MDDRGWFNRVSEHMSFAQSFFMGNRDISELGAILQGLLDLTESQYGYIGEALISKSGEPYFTRCWASVNNQKTWLFWDKDIGGNDYGLNRLDTIVGQVIRTGETFISNEASNLNRPSGWPANYSPINTILAIPLYKTGAVIGVIGLANRVEGYDLDLIHRMRLYQGGCANILISYRVQREKKELYQQLEKKNAELLAYASKLEQSNKELEHFATIASHDLQEPLRKVILFSDHCSSISQDLSLDAVDDLKRIQNAAARMQHLITDLLDLSRITRRGKPFQTITLRPLIEEVIARLHYNFNDIHAQIELNGDMVIEADPGQFQQMMTQLLDNALKFHKPNGFPHVIISIQSSDEGQCQITIEDNGIGMKTEHLDRIFDTFVRLHQGGIYPGTGIGLALVHKIIERHKGTITAESSIEKGSKFTIILPTLQQLDD